MLNLFLKLFVAVFFLGVWALKRELIIMDIDWRAIKNRVIDSFVLSLFLSTIIECFRYIFQTFLSLM